MIRALLAAALLPPAPPAPEALPMVIIQPASIVQVVCFSKSNIYSGTAFRIGQYFLSVTHVTSSGACYIGKNRIHIAYTSPKADFSMLSADAGPYLPIDCGGFVKGHKYIAIGFARGESPVTTLELTGTGDHDSGEALLDGMVPVIPGMSGGPVIDTETGKVVGTVNAENFEDGLSWSVELKNTPVCNA